MIRTILVVLGLAVGWLTIPAALSEAPPWAWVILVLTMILALFVRIKVIPQNQRWVIERLGGAHIMGYGLPVGSPRLALLFRWIDLIKDQHRVSDQSIKVLRQISITKDNIPVLINANLLWRIRDTLQDLYNASYGFDQDEIEDDNGVKQKAKDLQMALYLLAKATLRSIVGTMTFDEAMNNQPEIDKRVIEAMQPITDRWGTDIVGHKVEDVAPVDEKLLEIFKKGITARKTGEATVLEAQFAAEAARARIDEEQAKGEAEKLRRIELADAKKQEEIREEEGEARGLKVIMDELGVDGPTALNFRLAEDGYNALAEIGRSPSTKLVFADKSFGQIGALASGVVSVLQGSLSIPPKSVSVSPTPTAPTEPPSQP